MTLLGPAGIGGWQHREIQLGLVRQADADKTATPFPVIPVLLPSLQPDDVPLGTFLNLNTWVDLRPGLDEPEALQRLLAAAQGHAIDGLTPTVAVAQTPPPATATVDDLGQCKKLVRVDVPVERVDAMFEEITQQFQKFAQLPGFRPGKAPRAAASVAPVTQKNAEALRF